MVPWKVSEPPVEQQQQQQVARAGMGSSSATVESWSQPGLDAEPLVYFKKLK